MNTAIKKATRFIVLGLCFFLPKERRLRIDRWLRGELRDWAGDLLSARSLASVPLLEVAVVQSLWDRHQAKRENNGQQLWTLLMLIAWHGGGGSSALPSPIDTTAMVK